jgi:hypothetical protein
MEVHRQFGLFSGADEREGEDTPNGVEEERGRDPDYGDAETWNQEPTRSSLVLVGFFHASRK